MVSEDRPHSPLPLINGADDVLSLLRRLITQEEGSRLREAYGELLTRASDPAPTSGGHNLTVTLLDFLLEAPDLTSLFFQSRVWTDRTATVRAAFVRVGPSLLEQMILATSSFGYAVHQAFCVTLSNIQRMSFGTLARLLRLIALTIADLDLATDLLQNCFGSRIETMLTTEGTEACYGARMLFGLVLQHIKDMSANVLPQSPPISLKPQPASEESRSLRELVIRLDSSINLQIEDHVRLVPWQLHGRSFRAGIGNLDGLVVEVRPGKAVIESLQRVPSRMEAERWRMTNRITFTDREAMFASVIRLYTEKEKCCTISRLLIGPSPLASGSRMPQAEVEPLARSTAADATAELNASQSRAVRTALNSALTLIRTPPRTGGARTAVAIIHGLHRASDCHRTLIVANTHAHVDEILRRYISSRLTRPDAPVPTRVVNRVSMHISA